MSHVIGIDLGTTNSCVAIPDSAEVPGKDKLLTERRLRAVGGALVITDQNKAATTPSVVWIDRDGTVAVGHRAKQRAKLPDVPPPAMFFKRLMGTDQRITAGHREITPEEASAEVLKHMKSIAESVLGEPVDRAVITVPAFFEMNAKQATTRAGELAGLEVVGTLLEPVAAALMYTRTQQLDRSMKVLAYDLGGGTFDASLVTWDPDIGFEMSAFAGDRFLGGYDFDYAVVQWAISELDSYDLALEESDPRDKAILSRLMVLAESAKEDLAREIEVEIVDQRIEDRVGIPMSIRLPLSRATFEGLIAEKVDRTLASTDEVLGKAGVASDAVDEIIMVGGSSRIPLVGQRLQDRYGRKPHIVDPDLCVAVGAALKAATVATMSSYLSLERPPAETSSPTVDISGRVMAGPEVESVRGVRVELRSDDGMYSKDESTNADGQFLFGDIDLQTECENAFTVRVLAGGKVVDTQPVRIMHTWGARGGDIVGDGDVLAHDVSVMVEDGLYAIATAGTPVPHRTTIDLEAATQRGELEVTFLDGSQHIGRIIVTDLPRNLPIGSTVHVDLHFTKDWSIDGVARVPAAGQGAIGRATIDIPRVEIPSWRELQQRYRQLQASWSEMEESAPPAELLRVGPAIDSNLQRVQDLVASQHDAAQAHHVMQEAEVLLQSIEVTGGKQKTMRPPMSAFEERLEELSRLIDRLEGTDATSAANHRSTMRTLRTTGEAAYEAGHALDWTSTNESVGREIGAIKKELGEEGVDPLPPAPVLQLMVVQEIQELMNAASELNDLTGGRHADVFNEISTDANRVASQLMSVDMSNEREAARRIVGIYQGGVTPLRAKIEQWKQSVLGPEGGSSGRPDVRLPASRLG